MIKFVRLFGAALVALSIPVVVAAQAPLLDIRAGLWEVTSVVSIGGTSAPPAVSRSCMTGAESLDRPATQQPGTTCTQTIQTNTRSVLANTMTCTGERPSTAVARTEVQSPTAFTGTVTSTTTMGGRTTNVTIDMVGKWLGAACGDVK